MRQTPSPKAPIYRDIKLYSPYYLEKRFGGLEIVSRADSSFKEKPDNLEVFHRLEALEREWGREHLKVDGETLIIFDSNGTVAKIPIRSDMDREFLRKFYGRYRPW